MLDIDDALWFMASISLLIVGLLAEPFSLLAIVTLLASGYCAAQLYNRNEWVLREWWKNKRQ